MVLKQVSGQLFGLAPVAGGDEGGPIKGMRALLLYPPLTQQLQTGRTHGFRCAQTVQESPAVKILHPLPSGFVLHRPKTHDHSACAGDLESTAQPKHALAR